jgi:hypothetical protein
MGVNVTENFIIIEPDPIVAMDVEGLLTAQFPRACITAGASLVDIGPAIHSCGPETTLVVKGSIVAYDDDLRRVVREAAVRMARIVVIGGPFEFDFAVTFIELPFTSDMMLAVMTQDTPESDLGAPPAS